MTRLVSLALVLLFTIARSHAADTDGWRVTRAGGPRFLTVEIFVDSGTEALAAYQLTFRATQGDVKIAGIEGGEHPAFKEPPRYDAKAMQQDRVILAAFSTQPAAQLPHGRTRVATIHLQVSGAKEPKFSALLTTAANAAGQRIKPEISAVERKAAEKP